MIHELLWRLVYIAVPIWAPFYFLWKAITCSPEYPWAPVIFWTLASPFLFVIGIPLHVGWFLVNVAVRAHQHRMGF